MSAEQMTPTPVETRIIIHKPVSKQNQPNTLIHYGNI